MIRALCAEMQLRKGYIGDNSVETIYLGGGTPSLLTTDELNQLLNEVKDQYRVSPVAEITLEANPDDISNDKLIAWKAAGINRLSIGIQSFFEEDLLWMGRAHNAAQAAGCLELATRYFDNITIDLIYGVPGLTEERWKQNVQQAIALGIPHLSCYALTVEPKTPLDKMIREDYVPGVDTDQQASQFVLLMQWMEEAGYEHYEISNFSRPGWRSRHNTAYWMAATGKTYIGIGPSAHSFNGMERQWNVSNNITYIHALEKGEIPAEKELLNETQHLNEYIMTSLRTMEGTDLAFIQEKYGIASEDLLRKASKFISNQLLMVKQLHLVLTREGKLLADGIAADLFY
jgi:oxygen-independent coproporphyrinogen III oxidase